MESLNIFVSRNILQDTYNTLCAKDNKDCVIILRTNQLSKNISLPLILRTLLIGKNANNIWGSYIRIEIFVMVLIFSSSRKENWAMLQRNNQWHEALSVQPLLPVFKLKERKEPRSRQEQSHQQKDIEVGENISHKFFYS